MQATCCVPFLLLSALAAQDPPPRANADPLPVREVTVFKDGHAYVIRETALGADAKGRVVLDELPAPVLGTFWPYASGGARLVAAKSGRDEVTEQVPASDLADIARANVGRQCVAVTAEDQVEGEIVAVPRHGEGQSGDLLLVRTITGTRALPLNQVRDLEIRGEFAGQVTRKTTRERLELSVEGGGDGARVGVMYVQKGLRWIPAYRVDVDGAGKAAVQLEATVVNDLVDLERATVHLVIGVPKFEFEGLVDPISLQQEVAQVAMQTRGNSQFSNVLSNAIMTQTAQFAPAGTDPQPDVEGSAPAEDLFVFTVRDATLQKGERLVLPIASFELEYRDVYRLDVPFAPPMQVRENLRDQRALELARQLAAPKARHVLRLENDSDAPLTTAPALVLAGGKLLAQGRMTYTPRGSETDLEINVAIDVRVETDEHETGRTGNVRLGGDDYVRVEMAGAIRLDNKKRQAVTIEVTRRVLGLADAVGQDGGMRQLDLAQAWNGAGQPGWWTWWSWPYWWFRHNGFAEFRWTVELAPGAGIELTGQWHYFWR